MKKKVSLLLAAASVLALGGNLVACGGTVDPSNSSQNIIQTDDEYVIKFNNNFDGTVIKVTVRAGETVTLPEEPTRPGYKFVGWYLSYKADAKEAFDPTAPIYADITVYAKWEENISERIVVFHFMDNVTADKTITVQNGATLEKPADPVYPDGTKVFTGWYLDQQCTKAYDFTQNVTSSFDLYAGWKVSKATITFDLNYTGAAEASKVVVDIDAAMTKPADPTREHFVFLGWFDRSVGGTLFDFTKPIEGDATLYAHWEESEFLVSFDLNGATTTSETSVYGQKNGSVEAFASTLAESMSYPGHDFKGWYLTKLDANSDEDATAGKTPADLSSITSAMTVYAGWALSTYTVSFDLGYEGAPAAPASQSVKFGKTATAPEAPVREGYLFAGWFSDAGLTSQFTFDMPVNGNLLLTAKWIEDAGSHKDVTVTYHIGSTVYSTNNVKFNEAASTNAPSDPTKANALFVGWFVDEAFTTRFNMSANLTENVDVYAKFLDKNTIEAESADFTDKEGQGTSTNSFEEQMIMNYDFVTDGKNNVSNGYFVRELYYPGAFIDFTIVSSKAVTDAVLYLRVSSESYVFFTTKQYNGKEYNYLSEDEFKICVNTEWNGDEPVDWLKYGGLYMPMPNLIDREDLSKGKTPFEDMLITTNLNLREGENYITLLVTNNNNHGGTFHAEAPIIDAMHIYTDATLTWTDYEFYTRPNVNRG